MEVLELTTTTHIIPNCLFSIKRGIIPILPPRNKKESDTFKLLFPLSKLQASFVLFLIFLFFSPLLSSIHTQKQKLIPMYMKAPTLHRYSLFPSILVASAVVSFAFCLAAEFKKAKKDDLILDGKLCYLPASASFQLGIAALICLSVTQVAASLFICRKFTPREERSIYAVACSLLLLSWICFGVAVILLSAASSMSQSQAFGKGWLDGECYLVKDGVYAGSALLTLLTLGLILGSGVVAVRRKKAEETEGSLVHTKVDK